MKTFFLTFIANLIMEGKKKNTGGPPGKSGPKTLGGTPKCKLKNNCIVPGCEKSFRSDHFSEHYENKSDLVILDEARKSLVAKNLFQKT